MHQDIFVEAGLQSLLKSPYYDYEQLETIKQLIDNIHSNMYTLFGGFNESGEGMYWNNDCGWTVLENATIFTFDEMVSFHITPIYNHDDSFYERVGNR